MTTQYVELSDSIYDEITKRVRLTYPTACIVYLEKIQNTFLETSFNARKAALGPSVKVLQLFHGTTEKAVDSIIRSGFDPAYNTTSAYGIGTYFSPNASVSKDYGRSKKEELNYMIMSDVLIGKVGRTPASTAIDTKIMDISANDNDINRATIICTPYADGALPRYIVAFYRYAV